VACRKPDPALAKVGARLALTRRALSLTCFQMARLLGTMIGLQFRLGIEVRLPLQCCSLLVARSETKPRLTVAFTPGGFPPSRRFAAGPMTAEKNDYEHIRRWLTPHLASCVTRYGPSQVTRHEALRVTAGYG
jgi:hypothetical protein